jgi:hypothetical protein
MYARVSLRKLTFKESTKYNIMYERRGLENHHIITSPAHTQKGRRHDCGSTTASIPMPIEILQLQCYSVCFFFYTYIVVNAQTHSVCVSLFYEHSWETEVWVSTVYDIRYSDFRTIPIHLQQFGTLCVCMCVCLCVCVCVSKHVSKRIITGVPGKSSGMSMCTCCGDHIFCACVHVDCSTTTCALAPYRLVVYLIQVYPPNAKNPVSVIHDGRTRDSGKIDCASVGFQTLARKGGTQKKHTPTQTEGERDIAERCR